MTNEVDSRLASALSDGLGALLAEAKAAGAKVTDYINYEFGDDMVLFDKSGLAEFANRIRAAERERWDGVEQYLVAAADGSMSRNNSEALAAELLAQIRGPNDRAAVAAERERCAQVCEKIGDGWLDEFGQCATLCAKAIRGPNDANERRPPLGRPLDWPG
jgi:hypothetical protein